MAEGIQQQIGGNAPPVQHVRENDFWVIFFREVEDVLGERIAHLRHDDGVPGGDSLQFVVFARCPSKISVLIFKGVLPAGTPHKIPCKVENRSGRSGEAAFPFDGKQLCSLRSRRCAKNAVKVPAGGFEKRQGVLDRMFGAHVHPDRQIFHEMAVAHEVVETSVFGRAHGSRVVEDRRADFLEVFAARRTNFF